MATAMFPRQALALACSSACSCSGPLAVFRAVFRGSQLALDVLAVASCSWIIVATQWLLNRSVRQAFMQARPPGVQAMTTK